MNVYFVRHGQTDSNTARLHQHANTGLSKEGKKQSEVVAKRFAKIPIKIIISSDSARAVQTAEVISKIIKKKVILTKLLREKKWPAEIIGQPLNSPEVLNIKKSISEHSNDMIWHYSDEENFYDLKKRGLDFVKLLEKQKNKDVLVITHSKILRMVVGLMMFGMDLSWKMFESIDKFLTTENTGITLCKKEGNKWQMLTWNDYAHLG